MLKAATPGLIADIVSGYFELDRDAMLTRRDNESRNGRYITFWLCDRLTAHSRTHIGRLLGGHHNAHVSLGVHVVNQKHLDDPQFARMVGEVLQAAEAAIRAVDQTGAQLRPDADPLAIAERVLHSPREATLVSLAEIKVLATAVAIAFGPKGQNHARH